MAKEDKAKIVIHIDGNEFKTDRTSMTGADLKALAQKDMQFQVFLEGHGHDPDRQVGDAEGIEIKNGMHFYTVPPATFGYS